jgi:hypothetical protein
MLASVLKTATPEQVEVATVNLVKTAAKFGVVEESLVRAVAGGAFPKVWKRSNMALLSPCDCTATPLPHLTMVDYGKAPAKTYSKFTTYITLSLSHTHQTIFLISLSLSLSSVWNMLEGEPCLREMAKLAGEASPAVILFNLLVKVLKPLASMWLEPVELGEPAPDMGHQAVGTILASEPSLLAYQYANRVDLDMSFTEPTVDDSVAGPSQPPRPSTLKPKAKVPIPPVNEVTFGPTLPAQPTKRRKVAKVASQQDLTSVLNVGPRSPPRRSTPVQPPAAAAAALPAAAAPPAPLPAAAATPALPDAAAPPAVVELQDLREEVAWLRANLERRHPLGGLHATSTVALNLIIATAETTERSARYELGERVREDALGLDRDPERIWHGPDLLHRQ